jgi:hypothetical protein
MEEMMKIKYKIIWIFLIVLFASCNEKYNRIKESNDAYNEFKSKIPTKLLNNFPKTIKGNNTIIEVTYPEALKHNVSYCGVFIITKLTDSSFNIEYNKSINNHSFKGLVNDSQIVKIKVKSDSEYFSKYKDAFYSKVVYLIPDYYEKYSPLNKDSLSNDVKTIIIDAGKGEFLPKDYLENYNFLPSEYKHGYTKGIIFDKKKLKMIYWMILW